MSAKNVKTSLQKITNLVLIIVLILVSVTISSCQKNEIEYDEAEVLSEAERLLRSAQIVNSIFYGDGIHYVEGLNQNGIYCEADYTHLYSFGLRTLTDMKKLCLETYSESMSYMIFAATTDVSNDGSGKYLVSRYYAPSEAPDRLMVNTGYKKIFDDKMTYDYSTLKIEGATGEKIKLTVTALLNSTDESKTEQQSVTINVFLVKENGEYRIDNFVFANYNDAL